MSTMPVYAAVTRYGSHRPKHRRNIASRVPLIDPPPGSRCIPMRTVCYFVQRRRNSTHTREEARGAARERESVTDACRARCVTAVRSRAAAGRGPFWIWSSSCGLSSPRGDEIEFEKLLRGRRVARPVPRPRAAVGDLGGVARTRDASPPLRRTAAARLPPLLRGTAP